MSSIPVITTGSWAENIRDVHGDIGRAWLENLPATITICAEKWSLQIHPPFPALNYNYVTPAVTENGTPVVLKAGVPHQEFTSEVEALTVFSGKGMTKLLQADLENGVMLIERLQPGTFLSDLSNDEEITHRAISVMQKLHMPAPAKHTFTGVSSWADRAFSKTPTTRLPHHLVDLARTLFRELAAPQNESTLIHGDFHPQNILSSQRDAWLAIDPKGIVGDRLYDAAVFICQPPRQPTDLDQKHFLARRIDQIAERLRVDHLLITKWCLAHSGLSGCWSAESHGERWKPALARAAVLESLLKR